MLKAPPSCRLLAAGIAVILGVGLSGGVPAAPARIEPAPGTSVEYQIKAAFLYNFAKFVEWPPPAFDDDAPLTIGLLGEDPFGGAIDQAIEGKVVNGRGLALKRFAKVKDLQPTAILFISRSSSRDLDEIFERTRGAHVLTVGESDGFAGKGGVINFFTDENKVRFEINLEAARAAGLQISSKLLGVARIAPAGAERER
ncbi:MAG TPA: YfiR family protein [Candidatus Polarisedimenticolia bacterium]